MTIKNPSPHEVSCDQLHSDDESLRYRVLVIELCVEEMGKVLIVSTHKILGYEAQQANKLLSFSRAVYYQIAKSNIAK